MITVGLSAEKKQMTVEIKQYWNVRHSLNAVDGMVLYNDRVVIPRSLREQVMQSFHSVHQGVTCITSRQCLQYTWHNYSPLSNCREGGVKYRIFDFFRPLQFNSTSPKFTEIFEISTPSHLLPTPPKKS